MGGCEVTGEKKKRFFQQANEWSRSYRERYQHPNLSWDSITHGFLDPSAFPEICPYLDHMHYPIYEFARGMLKQSGVWHGHAVLRSGLWLQARAPWTEVESVQMTESRLAGVQKVFWAEGARVSQKSLAPEQTRFGPCNPMLRQCHVRKDLLRIPQSTLGRIS